VVAAAVDVSDLAHPVRVVEAMVVDAVDTMTTTVADLLVGMAETVVVTVATVTDHLLVADTTKMTTDVVVDTAIVALLPLVAVVATAVHLTTTLLEGEVVDTETTTHHQPVADMAEAVPLMMTLTEVMAAVVAETATTGRLRLEQCHHAEALPVMDTTVVAMVIVLPAEVAVTRRYNDLGQLDLMLEVSV